LVDWHTIASITSKLPTTSFFRASPIIKSRVPKANIQHTVVLAKHANVLSQIGQQNIGAGQNPSTQAVKPVGKGDPSLK
jgi:hypothetical protein